MANERIEAQKVLNLYMQLTAQLQAQIIHLQAANETLAEENETLKKGS